jgi:hypothetical protein
MDLVEEAENSEMGRRRKRRRRRRSRFVVPRPGATLLGSIVFSLSAVKKPVDDTQPRKIASIVNCMFGSNFKHVSRTNQSHMKQFWSMYKSHFKHVTRTNMLCYPVSKFMCRSQYKAILEHVWITFQEKADHK